MQLTNASQPARRRALWMAILTLIALTAAAAVVWLLGAARAEAAFSGPDGKIAFTSDRNAGNDNIWIMDADGANPVQLTTDAGSDRWPRWSPDGAQIAFHSDRDGTNPFLSFDIFVMDANGSNQTNLTNSPDTRDAIAAWSPDGTQIAFWSDRSGDGDIWIMDADGANPTQITIDGALDFAPDWSPDGSKILFSSVRDNPQGELYEIGVDGSNVTRLTFCDPNSCTNGVYSPDGNLLAYDFFDVVDDISTIFTLNADGSGTPFTVTTAISPSQVFKPEWSPDGRQILYTRNPDIFSGFDDVFKINLVGNFGPNPPINLTDDQTTFDFFPDQQPIVGTLVISKTTVPAGGTGFPFTVGPATYRYVSQWGSVGNGEGEFELPVGVAIDADGNVYVADNQSNNRVQKFDSDGTYLTQWGGSGNGNGQFSVPQGIAVDNAGNVYVVDFGNDRVQKFDSDGNYITQWGASGSGNGQFGRPYGIAVDSLSNVYVSDAFNGRVQKFNSNGVYLTEWAVSGPLGVAVDSADNVYVSSGSEIQKFDSSGSPLTQWGSGGSGDGEFDFALFLATDDDDLVYVTDFGNGRVQVFDSDGNYITQWGTFGTGNGQLLGPTGIAIAPSGDAYVVSNLDSRVQVFSRLTFELDDGEAETLLLAPGDITVEEMVPNGYTVTDIQCDTRGYEGFVPGDTRASFPLAAGQEISCEFTNTLTSACPVDPTFGTVGSELTTLYGTGMGSPTRSRMVAKVTIPNASDVTELYGQMAGKEYNGVRFVRYIFGDKSTIKVQPETNLGDQGAISWWGDDLTTQFQSQNRPFVKGRWFLQKGMKKMRIPRAIVFYATNDTGDTDYANSWSTFTYPDNFVASTPGFDQTNVNILPIPETQATTDIVVQLAVADVNRDPRTVDVIVRAGGVEQTTTLTGPSTKKSELLNLFEVTLEGVPAGTNEVEIELVSVLDTGDSAALLGAAAAYECGDVPLNNARIEVTKTLLNNPPLQGQISQFRFTFDDGNTVEEFFRSQPGVNSPETERGPFGNLPPGTYTIIEDTSTLAQFRFDSIICAGTGLLNETLVTDGVQITIDEGADVTCEFANFSFFPTATPPPIGP